MWETWVRSLGWEDPLEKRMPTHSSILAWRIPWTVRRIAKSQTRLSDFHFHLYNHKCMQEYKEINMAIPLKKKKKGPIELQTLASELLQRQQALAREETVPRFPSHCAWPARYPSSNPPAVWGGELPGYQDMCVKAGLSCPKGRCGTWSYCLRRLGQEVSLVTEIFGNLGWNSAETLKGIIIF